MSAPDGPLTSGCPNVPQCSRETSSSSASTAPWWTCLEAPRTSTASSIAATRAPGAEGRRGQINTATPGTFPAPRAARCGSDYGAQTSACVRAISA